MKEFRIGIVGTGVISHRHMKIWDTIEGAKVVAAAEIDSKKLKDWGEKYGFEEKDLYSDFREMLKRDDIDAIDVCVHNNLHTPVAITCMKAGFPTYSEKPMAASYADAKMLYDASKKLGVKLAIQISSIYNFQTRLAKKMIEDGKLGKVYHARTVGHRRAGRPGVDMPLSKDFFSKEVAGHGPMSDMGIYHLAHMLYILGMPELESVYGSASANYFLDERLLGGKPYEVEDLAVGMARFKNGLTMDIYEDWALNIDEVGKSLIAGELGGIKFNSVDSWGGEVNRNPRMPFPDLEFHGYEDGLMVVKQMQCELNSRNEIMVEPEKNIFNCNQRQWKAYVEGVLTDETRVNSPFIAMQTAKLTDGIFLSEQLKRSVTADEIEELSVSTSVRHQKTEWGVIDYEF